MAQIPSSQKNVGAIHPCLSKILPSVTHIKYIYISVPNSSTVLFQFYIRLSRLLYTEVKSHLESFLKSVFLSQVFISATCLWFLSSAINPIIHGVMNNNFRAEYKRIFYFVVSSVVSTSENSRTDEQEMSNSDSMARK